MAQERISILEDPNSDTKPTLNTLLRLAAAFDVGLDVRFVSFTKVLDGSFGNDPKSLEVQSFGDDPAFQDSPQVEPGSLPGARRSLVLEASEPSPVSLTTGSTPVFCPPFNFSLETDTSRKGSEVTDIGLYRIRDIEYPGFYDQRKQA